MRRLAITFAACVALSPGLASAQQNWYDQIFPNGRSFDFGTVARGSKIRHSFLLRNTTSHDIHVATWRTKCGCTEVKVGAKDIPPGTQTTIEATLDTTRFDRYKASGLVLVLDRPQFLELDLNLTCFIRSDVTLTPGGADFGVIPRGSKPSLTLSLTYAGQPGWQIVKVHTISDKLKAEVRPLGQSPGGGIQYQITAVLDPSTPPGYFRDEITLLTNDANGPSIPISVTADVQAAITVAPSVVNLGRVRPGQEVKRNVLVKSTKPFKITGVTAQKPDLTATNTFAGAKPIHTLTITLKAPTQPGPFNATVEIATDLKDEPPAKLTTFATVVP
jgi:hypothetical protein